MEVLERVERLDGCKGLGAGKRQAWTPIRSHWCGLGMPVAKKDKFHTCGGPRRRPCLGQGRGRRIWYNFLQEHTIDAKWVPRRCIYIYIYVVHVHAKHACSLQEARQHFQGKIHNHLSLAQCSVGRRKSSAQKATLQIELVLGKVYSIPQQNVSESNNMVLVVNV